MSKIVKNTTVSSYSIRDVGITIPASSQYLVPAQDYLLWAYSDDTVTGINSTDLVINDGLEDLSIADAIYYVRYPDDAFGVRFASDPERTNGFTSRDVQRAIEESRDVALNVRGKLVDFEFSSNGNTFNKWASVGHPSQTSDQSPFVANWSGNAAGLSFSNNNDYSDIDIEVYINNTLEYTWEIRNKRTAWKTLVDENSPLFSVSQGDRVSVFFKKVIGGTDINPADINGAIEIIIIAMSDGSGGTAAGT